MTGARVSVSLKTPRRGWCVGRMLALAGGALAPLSALAQQKAQGGGAKSAGAADKVTPSALNRGKFKSGAAKPQSESVDDATPLVLGCANATPTITFSPTPINGTLSNTDCTNPIDGSFYDAYAFTGTAGQQIAIQMTSAQFDTYLYLMKPGETTIGNTTTQNDDISDTNTNSQIINFTLPTTGTYTILANSFNVGATGSYTLTLSGGSICGQTTTPITLVSGSAVSTPGNLASGDCTLNDGSFYDVFTFSGTAGQQLAIQMNASFDAFLFLIGPDGDELARNDDGVGAPSTNARIPAGAGNARLPQTGVYRIIANSAKAAETGSYTLIVGLNSNACPSTPITSGQTVNGSLQTSDCRLPADSSFINTYTFSGTAGQNVSITMTSSVFDAYLILLDPGGINLDEDDNGAGGTNAHLPSGKRTFTGVLSATGNYTIYVFEPHGAIRGRHVQRCLHHAGGLRRADDGREQLCFHHRGHGDRAGCKRQRHVRLHRRCERHHVRAHRHAYPRRSDFHSQPDGHDADLHLRAHVFEPRGRRERRHTQRRLHDAGGLRCADRYQQLAIHHLRHGHGGCRR